MNARMPFALICTLALAGCSEAAHDAATSTPAKEARAQAAHEALTHQDSDTVKTVPRQYRIKTITPPGTGDSQK